MISSKLSTNSLTTNGCPLTWLNWYVTKPSTVARREASS